jgi:hypothetical protein
MDGFVSPDNIWLDPRTPYTAVRHHPQSSTKVEKEKWKISIVAPFVVL